MRHACVCVFRMGGWFSGHSARSLVADGFAVDSGRTADAMKAFETVALLSFKERVKK